MMSTATNRTTTPPNNLEAEKTVLGALLIDPDVILKVLPILSASDFYDPVYRVVFEACTKLHDDRQPLDFVTVANELKSDAKIESLGGSAFLANLAESVPTASNAASYARIVHQKSLQRALIAVGQRISKLGYEEGSDSAELVERSHLEVLSLSHAADQSAPETLADISVRRYDQVAELQSGNNPAALRSVKTGFSNIDYYFNGLAAGSLTVIAARPSMGKTSLAVNMAMNAATGERKNVLFFSLEMAKEEISDRITASLLGVSTWQMQKGDMTDEQVGQLGAVIDTVSDLPLFIDDDPDSTISNIRAKAIRHQLEHGLDLLIVDYLQLIEPPPGKSRENRVQEVSAISRGLKKLAKELHAPVIALSQLSRAVENRPKCIPHLADLRDSGTIEQDADNVLMLWREGYYEEDCDQPDRTTVFIRKNRQGPTAAPELVFDQEKMSFSPLDRSHSDSGSD